MTTRNPELLRKGGKHEQTCKEADERSGMTSIGLAQSATYNEWYRFSPLTEDSASQMPSAVRQIDPRTARLVRCIDCSTIRYFKSKFHRSGMTFIGRKF